MIDFHKALVQSLENVSNELYRQDKKFGAGRQLSKDRWLTILTEELGEVAEAVLDDDFPQFKKELKEIAAVALQAIYCSSDNTQVETENE